MSSGIYVILNTINDKYYVGSAVNFGLRWNFHKSKLNRKEHKNKHLQLSWNKYGKCAFLFVVLEYVEREKLIEREQHWLDELKASEFGYNICPKAGSNLGRKFNWTKEHLEKIGNGNRGKKASPETLKRMSEALKGRIITNEHRRKLSEAGKGRVFSVDSKNKIGLANSNPEKWPCKNKSKCNCTVCSEKKNKARRDKTFKRKWGNFSGPIVIIT